MDKLIITHWGQGICTALAAGRKVLQIDLGPEGTGPRLNNIYIGKVQNIQKNINAAFVDIGGGVTGYYSLYEGMRHLYADQRSKGTDGPARKLKVGDEIVVQICREAVKTKAPVLTEKLSFAGKLAVLTLGKTGIGSSNKITDQGWKQEMRRALGPLLEREPEGEAEGAARETLETIVEPFGIVIRTNGRNATIEGLQAEIRQLKAACKHVLDNACYRSCYSLLYQAPATFLAGIRNAYADRLEEIVTDDPVLYEQIHRFLKEEQPEDVGKLRLYQDDLLSLKALYSLDKVIEDALSKRVWLKSGGYLVIEPTEALVVVDVNTGKCDGKKTKRETILKINLEAAEEIGRQLRLRNLSGIILIDLIDMTEEEDRVRLLEHLETVLQKDPIKTNVVDMTRLGLVELTRKRIHRPLYEQVAALSRKGTKEGLV